MYEEAFMDAVSERIKYMERKLLELRDQYAESANGWPRLKDGSVGNANINVMAFLEYQLSKQILCGCQDFWGYRFINYMAAQQARDQLARYLNSRNIPGTMLEVTAQARPIPFTHGAALSSFVLIHIRQHSPSNKAMIDDEIRRGMHGQPHYRAQRTVGLGTGA